LSNIEYTTIYL